MPTPEEKSAPWPRLQAPDNGFFLGVPAPTEVADENGLRMLRPPRYGRLARWGALAAIGLPLFWLGWKAVSHASATHEAPDWVIRGGVPFCLAIAWGGIAYAVERTHHRNIQLGPVIQWCPGSQILSFPRAATHEVPLKNIIAFHLVKGVFNVGKTMDSESAMCVHQLWAECSDGTHICIFSGGYTRESRIRKLLAAELNRPLIVHHMPKNSFVVVRGWSNC